MRHLVPALLLLVAAARAQEQSAPTEVAPTGTAPADVVETALPARFAGWDALRDPDFRFDPDQRAVLGFSVHATPAARAALESAEAALAAGDPRAAARRYADMISGSGDEVLQVQGGHGRWVGAGEWALHELLTRVPGSARAGLTRAAEQQDVDAAARWRDLPRLRRLAAALEGRDAGRQAAALFARLLAERGESAAARAAAERAAGPGAAGSLAGAGGAPSPVPDLQLPASLAVSWRSGLVINAIGSRNPFTADTNSFYEAPIAPIAPAVADDVAYVSDSLSLSALDVLSGRTLWHHAGPLELVDREGSASHSFGFGIYTNEMRQRAVSPYQCLTPLLTERLVISTEQVAEAERELKSFEGIPINWPLPRRRLVALDRRSGAVVWQQEHAAAGPDDFRNTFDVAGPPMVGGGVVYAAGSITEGAINSYAAGFDEQSGDLLWQTLLCSGQQDLTMFNRPFQEHTASPPLLHEGALYVVTNLGVVGSVDGFSGRLRWLAGYESTARRASRSPERDQRRDVNFVNRPPLIEAGRLIVAPLDTTRVLALDPQTGREVWTLDAQWTSPRGGRHDVLGTGDGRLFVVSDQTVECFDAGTGALRWTSAVGLQSDERLGGAATLVGHNLLLPVGSRLIALDIDAPARPQTRAWQGPAAQSDVRRVVAAGPALLLIDNREIFGVVDMDAALQRALAAVDGSLAAQLQAAELLLAKHRLGEAAARFDAALSSADGVLAARARSGRLEAATQTARDRNDVAGWQELLAVARRLGDPWSAAQQALPALAALGADDAVDDALAGLAALDAERLLDLGRLTPDGGQPTALLLAQRRLRTDAPEAAVARLQEMITRWPEARWDGVPVRQAAARRIAALLEEQGPEPYARFEREAEAALAAAGPDGRAAVEARYPNAHAVAAARTTSLRERLQRGEAREVFEELGALSSAGADRELVELRAQAARQLGETAFAEALLDGAATPGPATLPALPGAEIERASYEISALGPVIFPKITGNLGAPYERCAVGAVNQQGELFLIDTASGGLVWRHRLPGRTTYLSQGSGVDFLTDGTRLFVQIPQRGAPAGSEPRELVEAIALADGRTLWSAELPGESRGTTIACGLLLRLCGGSGEASRRFRVDGYGAATGTAALSVDLPPAVDCRLYTAGPHVVVFTAGDVLRDGSNVDSRLSVLDVPHGALRASVPLPGEAPSVVAALDEPPVLLLARRAEGSSAGTMLSAWDPASLRVLWESELGVPSGARQNLYPAGQGRVLLFEPVSLTASDHGSVLTPIDALTGPLPPTAAGAGLLAVNGQSRGIVPRLVMLDRSDPGRLVVADAATSELRYEVRLPAAGAGSLRVAHGRDGFLLVQEPLLRDAPSATLRLFDAVTGNERYSAALPASGQGASEMALVEGAVLVARGGVVTILRSSAR